MAFRHLANSGLLLSRKSLTTTILKQATVPGLSFARASSYYQASRYFSSLKSRVKNSTKQILARKENNIANKENHVAKKENQCVVCLPKVQSPAPNFTGTAVVQGEFKTICLNEFSGKYLYLFFYPMDFTFVCPTEIIAFSDRMADFDKLNTAIVGCSCDSHFSHLAWTQTPRKKGGLGEIKYPLLADFKKVIARDYNVLLENDGVPLRGSFLIDPKGIIRQVTINDLPVGRSVDEVLRLIKAFQFVDSHGEVCPANWNPDKPTIKPNPKDSIEYFNKVNPS